MAKDLQQLSESLDKLIKAKKDKKALDERTESAALLGTVIAGLISPVLEELKSEKENILQIAETTLKQANLNAQRQLEDNARLMSAVSEAIKTIKPEVTVNVPDVNIPTINIPEIRLPEINIPEIKAPQVNVTVPDITMPEINVPEPKVTVNMQEREIDFPDRMKVDFDRISREFPLPILAVDQKGEPVNFTGGYGGSKADFFTIKDVKKDGISLIDVDSNLSVGVKNDGLSISQGLVTGQTYVHKFGEAPDFDEADGQVTIWDGANDGTVAQMDYVYSTTADIDSISSSDNTDTQTVSIQGLDANYLLVTQTITLTGQTRAALTTPLIRVFRMLNTGTTNFAGQVYCYVNTAIVAGVPVDTTKIRAAINDGNNQTLMAVYTVPAGKTAYLDSFYAAVAGASKASNYIIELYARPTGKVFNLKNILSLSDTGSSYLQHDYKVPEKFVEKTDIEMRVKATASGATAAAISGGFDLILIDN